MASKLEVDDIEYPRDIFHRLLDGNSPYAFYLLQWVPYQTDAKKWRLKMMHDIKTFDGREFACKYPNGNSFSGIKDEDIEFIRISKEQFGVKYEDPRDK